MATIAPAAPQDGRVRKTKFDLRNEANIELLAKEHRGLKMTRGTHKRWNRATFNLVKMGKDVLTSVTSDEIHIALTAMASITAGVKLFAEAPMPEATTATGNSTPQAAQTQAPGERVPPTEAEVKATADLKEKTKAAAKALREKNKGAKGGQPAAQAAPEGEKATGTNG